MAILRLKPRFNMNISNLTIKQVHGGLKEMVFSAVELIQTFYKNILDNDAEIGAYLNLTDEIALPQAKIIDKKIARKEEIGILEGVPLAIKDNILVKDFKCTAGSKILGNYLAPYDATVVKKIKSAGGIILGKTNMDEFAMGSSTENSAYKKTKNPRDLKRVPGGSSGGSAAAVATDMAIAALGSDTGGSIRQPASFCGIVGLKPTYGSVSRYGLIAMASSLDQIGPLAKTVEDVEILFNIIKGQDELDSTSIEYPDQQSENLSYIHRASNKKENYKNFKIGLPKEYFAEGLDKKVETEIKNTINKLEKAGLAIEEISLPNTPYALAVYYIIMPAEVSANLARYDGIRYGFSESNANSLEEVYSKSRGQGFGKEVRRRIMLGTYVLSHGYYDAYYLKAQKVRTKIIEDFSLAFEKVDVILTPTSPILPFKFGEKTNPLSMYLADIYTVPINIAGVPAISIPTAPKSMVGFQLIAPWFRENRLFEIGKLYEQLN